ncbi:MAG TPA: hypothetical protein VNZ64_27295 [Candidatus Acidoferrum sp.]|jgi:hypothetical protein|nr:hypothetical protein [Candidatus Acidoferrum sp.]
MLLRLSLIIAIIAGLAVGTLNFLKTKEKIVNLVNDRNNEKSLKETALNDLHNTQQQLAKTNAILKQTQAELASTKDERDKAVAEAADKTKKLETVTTERDNIRKERDLAQADLEAYKVTGLTPPQILAMNKQYKELQKENDLLGKIALERMHKIQALTNELAIYKSPDYVVPLPANLRGKVLVTDPKWNFVVLNIGQDQGVLEYGELLVNRDGRLVAKVKVRSVQKDRSIANVMPGWQLGEVMEGDQVIPAHPETPESGQVTAASAETKGQVTTASP